MLQGMTSYPPIEYILAEADDFLNNPDSDDDDSITFCSVESTATPKQLLGEAGRRFELIRSRWASDRLLEECNVDPSAPSLPTESSTTGGRPYANHGLKCPRRRASVVLEVSANEARDRLASGIEEKACTNGPKCPPRRASLILSLSAYEAAASNVYAQAMGSICETKCDETEKEARKREPLRPRRKPSIVIQLGEGGEREEKIQRCSIPKCPSRRSSVTSLGSIGSLGSLGSFADLGSLVLSLASQEIAEQFESEKRGIQNAMNTTCSVPVDLLEYETQDKNDPAKGHSASASPPTKGPAQPYRKVSLTLSVLEYECLAHQKEDISAIKPTGAVPPKHPCRKPSLGFCESEDEDSVVAPRRESLASILIFPDERRLSSVPSLMAFDLPDTS